MLKGTYMTTDFFGTLIFIATVLILNFFIIKHGADVKAEIAIDKRTLDVVDTAQLVRKCLMEKGVIDSEILNKYANRPFYEAVQNREEICKLKNPQVKITDLETRRIWTFTGSEPTRGVARVRNSEPVFVPLKVGNAVHMGEMYVEI